MESRTPGILTYIEKPPFMSQNGFVKLAIYRASGIQGLGSSQGYIRFGNVR